MVYEVSWSECRKDVYNGAQANQWKQKSVWEVKKAAKKSGLGTQNNVPIDMDWCR